ncbi:MAG TPA: four helix bundle protein [Chitinophagales bacterium]|nr:four helix bundle protein [Chitinophagales bacterium]
MEHKRGFENLEVWKKCRELKQYVSELCKKFPKHEMYLLTAQVKDSSRSVTANIAEGYGRFHFQENIQFCRQSRGSLEETKDHIYTSLDESYITKEDFDLFIQKYDLCLKILNGYIFYIEEQKRKSKP